MNGRSASVPTPPRITACQTYDRMRNAARQSPHRHILQHIRKHHRSTSRRRHRRLVLHLRLDHRAIISHHLGRRLAMRHHRIHRHQHWTNRLEQCLVRHDLHQLHDLGRWHRGSDQQHRSPTRYHHNWLQYQHPSLAHHHRCSSAHHHRCSSPQRRRSCRSSARHRNSSDHQHRCSTTHHSFSHRPSTTTTHTTAIGRGINPLGRCHWL